MSIDPRAARSLAVWLAMTHADLFNRFAAQLAQAPLKEPSKGMGDWTDVADVGTTTNFDDTANVSADPTLTTVAVDPVATTAGDIQTPPDNSSSVSSWFSSIGSGLSSAVSSVASALTNPGVLTSLGNATATYFKSQANQATAQAQTQIAQAQIARTAAGQTVAPIAYVRNPQTGVLQAAYVASPNTLPPSAIAAQNPLLVSAGGQVAYPLTRTGLAQLTPSSLGAFFSQYGVWILGAAAALWFLSRRRSSET